MAKSRYARHEKTKPISRAGIVEGGFVGCFFGLPALFRADPGIELGFDYPVGPGGLYQLLRPDFDRAFDQFRDVVNNDS
jgi:hypothetical protein